MSKICGGCMSDKEITEKSEIFGFLLLSDQVLVNRWFTCAKSFALYSQSLLIIPAFTRGKPQLSAKEVQYSRDIANFRIHVECHKRC